MRGEKGKEHSEEIRFLPIGVPGEASLKRVLLKCLEKCSRQGGTVCVRADVNASKMYICGESLVLFKQEPQRKLIY